MALPQDTDATEALLPITEPDIIEDVNTGPAPAPSTFSHALAQDSISKSEEQVGDGTSAWNTDASAAQTWYILHNLTNQHAWALIRRFNRQIFCVRSIDNRPFTTLDMNAALVDDLSPERLRAHVERLYMTVFVAMYSFYKQIVRLRSWREKQRTLSFLAVYALAWHINFLMPALTAFLMVLIVHPPAREKCFPPAPPSLIDSDTGGVKSPLSGQLASDSVTAAAENHPGEAVELEAHDFMKSISKLVMTMSSGQHPQGDTRGTDRDDALNPSSIVECVTNARDKAEGIATKEEVDGTKSPISNAMERFGIHPAMQMLPELLNNWERFENALSPTPPFPRHRHRLILAACLLPLLIVFCSASWQTIMHGAGFINGFVFFGDPIIQFFIGLLDKNYPRWRAYLEPRHTILRGVPTNAQLTVTILRIGEGNNSPLPPPPSKYQPASAHNDINDINTQELDNIGAPRNEVQAAVEPSSDTDSYASHNGSESDGQSKTVRRVADAIKRTTKGGVKVILKIDKAKASAGREKATERLGALEVPGEMEDAGPIRFPARYHGEKGYAYVTTTATSPAISWRLASGDLKSAWTVSLAHIGQIRKIGGLGWKSKAVVGAVLGWKVADGIVITTREGAEFHLAAITRRDELFNRLISMRGHMWEIW